MKDANPNHLWQNPHVPLTGLECGVEFILARQQVWGSSCNVTPSRAATLSNLLKSGFILIHSNTSENYIIWPTVSHHTTVTPLHPRFTDHRMAWFAKDLKIIPVPTS